MEDIINKILSFNFYGNSGKDYLLALAVFAICLLILLIVKKVILARLHKIAKRTKNNYDDTLIGIIFKIKSFFYLVISLYLASNFLNLSNFLSKAIYLLFILVIVYEGIKASSYLLKVLAYKAIKRNDDDSQAQSTVKTLNVFIQIILWSLGLLLILANMGVNITSLIAGLGIGGIAVALALQNILADIFSSFSILIDKPFKVGDFIKVSADMGTVEKIGIKTTHLRTLDGQLLIISNQELTKARVENFQKLHRRRALFNLGIVYETSRVQLESIPKIIASIVDKQEKANLDRCHFKSYGDFSLNFEVSIFIDVKSYNDFLDILEKINLDIFSQFNEQGISFAYPTQLHYQKTA
ncbi:MAG: mechanosensitive ion channel family protein [Patescibacteria group bacterium]|nr:mechanosensitive ion channel family protein [Patescibacteria group bacterium]